MFDALDILGNKVGQVGATLGTPFVPLVFDCYEFAFWFLRVRSWNVTGNIEGTPFNISTAAVIQSGGLPVNEYDVHSSGNLFETDISGPLFYNAQAILGLFSSGQAQVVQVAGQGERNDRYSAGFQFFVQNVNTGQLVSATSGASGSPSAFGCLLQGTDLLAGRSYSSAIQLWMNPAFPDIAGSITMTPVSWWGFDGRYDTGTGGLI